MLVEVHYYISGQKILFDILILSMYNLQNGEKMKIQINKDKFTADFESGKTLTELGQIYGCSRQTANNRAREWGLKRPEPDLASMRVDWEDRGLSTSEMAKKYNITPSQVGRIIAPWTHAKYSSNEEERWCNYCKSRRPRELFAKGDTYCKPCNTAYRRERRNNHIERALAELGMAYECEYCGYNKSRAAIDMHHIDEKEGSIGQLSGYNSIKKEIEKCIPLCRNCHRVEHGGLIVKEALFEISGREPKCSECGENRLATLEFHHRRHTYKAADVSRMLQVANTPRGWSTAGWTLEEICLEIDKCDVVCGNCHREKTYPDA